MYALNIGYLETIIKYFDKNSTCIDQAMDIDHSLDASELVRLAVDKQRDLKWFKIVFDLYTKMNKVPRKEDFEKAMKHTHFVKISKECQTMIKENYNKFYPI